MIHTYTRTEPDILRMQGTPDELWGEDAASGFTDSVCGLTVVKVSTDGKHDGFPATIAHLADDMGDRVIGRLVLRHDVTPKKEIFEWERLFAGPDVLENFVTAHENAVNEPVVTSWQDLCWDGYPTADHAVAATCAEFGVSVEILRSQGGNGWPEVRIFGLRSNVRRCLIEGWKLDPKEVDAELK